jgi:hypothetical protein
LETCREAFFRVDAFDDGGGRSESPKRRRHLQWREMKLLTHNMLACHIKGVKNNYPFKIEAKKVEEREAEFNPGTVNLSGTSSDKRNHYANRV